MIKKSLITLSIILFTSVTHAETCPTVSQIKLHNFQGWGLFDRDGNTQPSDNFTNDVASFALGYFAPEAPEGEAQCYYKDSSGSDYMNVYLAKETLHPDTSSVTWVAFNDGRMECYSNDPARCLFVVGNS